MTQPDFLRLLEVHLQARRVEFSRAALWAFVEAAWPRIVDDPDVEFFASEFLAGEPMVPV